MDEVPAGMLRLDRKEDPTFSPEEWVLKNPGSWLGLKGCVARVPRMVKQIEG